MCSRWDGNGTWMPHRIGWRVGSFMGLTIKFQPTGLIPNNPDPIVMDGSSVTIGRGGSNSLTLVDNERMISTNHCVIEDKGGEYVILDISTNGTFLNYGKIPIGDNPTILSDGDIISIGPYELLIDLSEKNDADPMDFQNNSTTPAPFQGSSQPELDEIINVLDEPEQSGDFLTDLVGEGPKKQDSLEASELDDDIDIFSDISNNNDDPLSKNVIPDDIDFGSPVSDHSPSVQDSFVPSKHSVIPDDWDDDALSASEQSTSKSPQNIDPFVDDFSGSDTFMDLEENPSQNGNDYSTTENLEGQSTVPVQDLGIDGQDSVSKSENNNDQKMIDNLAMDDDPLDFSKDKEEAVGQDLINLVALPNEQEHLSSKVPHEIEKSNPLEPSETVSVNAAAISAFIHALDIEDFKISDDQLVETMGQMGTVCKVLITGIREVLMTRSSIKNEFKLNQTMIGARGNNPLKFSVSAEEAVKSIVMPASKGYLNSDKAAEEALRDIKAHEIAMISGMEVALKSVLNRLSPKKLEAMMEEDGKIGGLLKGKKARYWEVYEKMYSQISEQAENEFHEFFSKEFSQAYEDQLEKLK